MLRELNSDSVSDLLAAIYFFTLSWPYDEQENPYSMNFEGNQKPVMKKKLNQQPKLCDICKAPPVHKNKWGVFCDSCWKLFAFDERKRNHRKRSK
jgi:hypothetical protein